MSSNKFQLKSIEEIQLLYEDWKLQLPDNINELSGSKKRKWLQDYNVKWKENLPWIEEVVVDGKVKGILCKVCRERASGLKEADAALIKCREVLVNVPLVRFGAFVETAMKHEFGVVAQACKKEGVVAYRKKVIDGSIPESSQTSHMKQVILKSSKKVYASNTVLQQLQPLTSLPNENRAALSRVLSLLHRCIKRRDSPFSSLKDAVQFQIEVMGCNTLKRLIKKGDQGLSARRIKELIESIFDLTCLGMYVEITKGLQAGEHILFGAMIDLGSKIQKTKEYAGVGIKVVATDYTITRVIAFKKCPRKDGLALLNTIMSSLCSFNSTIQKLKINLKDKFPVSLEPLPLLQAENITSLGVDGACISNKKMINMRILAKNA